MRTTLSLVPVFFLASQLALAEEDGLQLVRRRAPDGSITVAVPQGWSFAAGKGMFESKLGGQAPRAGAVLMAYEILSPAYRTPGAPALFSEHLPPADCMVWLLGQAGFTNARVLGAEAEPGVAQEAAAYTGRSCDAASVIAEFTSSDGVACCGFATMITTEPLPYSGSWLAIAQAFWAPKESFAACVPTFRAMAESVQVDNRVMQTYIAASLRRLHEMERQTSAMIARNHQQFTDDQNALAAEKDRVREWTSYLQEQSTLGQGDWVAEDGHLFHSDGYGVTDTTTGDRWEGTEYNNNNLSGHDPRGGPLNEVNTREEFERLFRGR